MNQPPDPAVFNALVWEIVRQVPEGMVSTYGQIASMIPPPHGVEAPEYDRLGARWVGSAMRAVPAGSGIPWHRIINSQGGISLPAGSAGADEQRRRLEMEGVSFDGRGRIDLDRFGWDGPAPAWLEERGLLVPRPLRKTTARRTGDDTQPGLF
jgi:methylated-DNA-protein-cysteine methyltransferase-like protein